MNEEEPRNVSSLEQENWLKAHTVLNNQFLEEARRYNIKPFTHEFWVYNKHRDYEVFGKHDYCFTGIERLAEDTQLTERQVINAYGRLQEKGAIKHVWCDQKIYRGKTRLFISSPHIKNINLEINKNNLVAGNAKKLPEGKQSLVIEESSKNEEESRKKDSESSKKDLNNSNNNTKEHKTFFKQPKIKIDKLTGKVKLSNLEQDNVRKVLNIFATQRGGVYDTPYNNTAIASLISQQGIDIVLAVAEFALALEPKPFQPTVSQPIDLAQKWDKFVTLMDNPKPQDNKEGWT